MGNLFYKKDTKDLIFNYHCKKCSNIPLIHFSNYDFNIICSKHKILNIPLKDFSNFITEYYECSYCKKSFNEQNFFYCYECDKNFCGNCLEINKQYINNHAHKLININDKDIICKYHKKNYDRFCLKCKLNLCELCEEHKNHYIEFFKDILPLEKDILHFKEISTKIINRGIVRENEIIKIKSLFIDSFLVNKSNYYYINNVNNIIHSTYFENENLNENNIAKSIEFIENSNKGDDANNIENKILIK